MILRTPRLTLRPLAAGDAEALHGLMSDALVMAYWDIREIDDLELTRMILEGQIKAAQEGEAIHWAMVRDADSAFIGVCDLSDIDPWHKRAEIGFLSARSVWGEGYTLEAMQAVLDHAAQQLHIKKLAARTHVGNVRSVRLLQRLGFEQEGVLRGHIERDGERRDCLLFGLLL
ncbi:GNAT family N-acetyltransferase [Phenylobacterium montanum]|uniref:GNAT family N-acetyltransferase n=1 Tax=Phenylobacterium montanum TaxID=2823693 RepID=A0A975FZV2_9CAUL|nr:GNAT family N-acetyltransferase [Caulobacter sp. S6]QUD88543.1 GNAT family N-acetyltransferase [Caulobacter sp. S6]